VATKVAQIVSPGGLDARAEERGGLRELDSMTESMPGLSRQQRDRARISPRATPAPLGHQAKQRPLPAAGQPRVPFSSRQKKARSKTRVSAQDSLPDAQYQAQRRLMTSPSQWSDVNEALSAATGDVGALDERTAERVRRVDRSIQAYEKVSDRGHVLYANVSMPPWINHTSLPQFVARNFQAGDAVDFDRFTYTTHQLHETTAHAGEDRAGRVAVFEIQTRRGAYLGHSDSMDDTSHLLPRGMRFQVVGTHQATWTDPQGRSGRRTVIQLRDTTPEPSNQEMS